MMALRMKWYLKIVKIDEIQPNAVKKNKIKMSKKFKKKILIW